MSSSARIRASGVRSSWETDAVKPVRSSWNVRSSFTTSSPFRHRGSTGPRSIVRAVARVLIVEDDNVIADGMARHLVAAGFDPVVVGRGELGLARLRYENPDVCVLDLMLPELDGWKLIEMARAEGIGTPIVVVSARGTEHDRVHALEIGADDYLVKPFSMRELVARVGAAARRGVRPAEERRGDAIEIEELRIDPREVQAFVGGKSAGLTPTEFKLLYTLALDRGRVVTRDELLQKVWGGGRRTATARSTSSSAVFARRSTARRRRTRSSRHASASATSSSQSPSSHSSFTGPLPTVVRRAPRVDATGHPPNEGEDLLKHKAFLLPVAVGAVAVFAAAGGAASPDSPQLTNVPTANTKAAGYAPPRGCRPSSSRSRSRRARRSSRTRRESSPTTATRTTPRARRSDRAAHGPDRRPAEAQKTEPDKNTYLVFKQGSVGRRPAYDYGTQFLYQGHEVGATVNGQKQG